VLDLPIPEMTFARVHVQRANHSTHFPLALSHLYVCVLKTWRVSIGDIIALAYYDSRRICCARLSVLVCVYLSGSRQRIIWQSCWRIIRSSFRLEFCSRGTSSADRRRAAATVTVLTEIRVRASRDASIHRTCQWELSRDGLRVPRA